MATTEPIFLVQSTICLKTNKKNAIQKKKKKKKSHD
jgi:hypothetical protein